MLRNFLFCLGSSDAVQCLLAYLEVLISDDLGYLEHSGWALSKPEKPLELPAIKNVTKSFVLKCMQIIQRKHPRVSPRQIISEFYNPIELVQNLIYLVIFFFSSVHTLESEDGRFERYRIGGCC